MERKVTMIPPTINPQTHLPKTQKVKRKVAGYARVSTDFEEQLTSYAAQVDYYTKYIQKREDWEFVKVYTDEGISATSMTHRNGFNQMIADALDGKIDLIITKSVSRFARNTVDSLTTVRKLKEKNVEGRDCSTDLQAVFRGKILLCNCKKSDRPWYSNACRKGTVAYTNDWEYPDQRKIQRCCSAAKEIYCGFSYEKDQSK